MELPKILFIVGNGFDLAHGLKTSFCDFKNYLQKGDESSKKFIDALEQYTPLEKNWSNIEEALGKLDYETLCEKNSCYLVSPYDDKYRDSANFDYTYEISKEFNFYSDLSFFLRSWIESINKEASPIFKIPDNASFLSFNYTNTLEIVYGVPKNKICYIHGDYSKKGDRLIIGHNDKLVSSEVQLTDEESDVIQFEAESIIKSYFESSYKKPHINIEIHKSFFDNLKSVEEIIIIGESFRTDLDYFLKIKENVSSDCVWRISFHDLEDYRNNFYYAKEVRLSNYTAFQLINC